MLKKVLTLIIVVMAIALVAATAASAQEPEATDGGLRARGDGIAVLRGTGMVDLSGNGTLWVKDLGGDAIIRVTGTGHKKEFSDGWIQYAGFDGAAHVAGSRVHVILAGVDVNLVAFGHGSVYLWGHGTYHNADGTGEWHTAGSGAYVRVTEAAE
jgi:hypothetical protein